MQFLFLKLAQIKQQCYYEGFFDSTLFSDLILHNIGTVHNYVALRKFVVEDSLKIIKNTYGHMNETQISYIVIKL